MNLATGLAALEVHLTVDPRAPAVAVERLRDALDGRVVSIELRADAAPLTQSMVTFDADATTPLTSLRERVATVARLHDVTLLRVKVEARPSPALAMRYRESHALLRAPRAWFDPLPDDVSALIALHDARLSHNARREDGHAQVDRYLTRRDRGTYDDTTARHRAWVDALTTVLARHPDATLVKLHDEAVVWDDHEAMDEGWR